MGPPLISGGNAVRPTHHRPALALASMGPPLISGGNLGMAATVAWIGEASMGPPLISGGNAELPSPSYASLASFNGAAADQRRK